MSQQALLAPFTPLGEKNVVPAYTRYENPSRQSVILSRDKTAFVPTSGSSYTVGGSSGNSNQIAFLMSDASRFLDLPSAYLAFDYALTRTDATAGSPAGVLVADNAVSLFNRCQVKLGGLLLEDITNLNTAFNTRMHTNMNKDYYENSLDTLCGSWVYNMQYGGASVSLADLASRKNNAERTSYNAVVAATSTRSAIDEKNRLVFIKNDKERHCSRTRRSY